MIQDFLNAIAGTEQKQYDPMEVLIPKENMGNRSYKPYFKMLTGASVAMLVVTLSEIHPIFNGMVTATYLGLVLFGVIDAATIQKNNGYITKERVKMLVIFYVAIALVMTVAIQLVRNI